MYSLDYARTRLANDAKSAKGGGARQFNGLVDVYKKTLASDGIAGLYRGFVPSVVGIIVYRGLYFGVYDSLSKSLIQQWSRSIYACCRTCRPGGSPGRIVLCVVLAWLGCHNWCRSRVVSS